MLSIGKLGKGQERYYLDKVAEGAEDYYSGEGEAEGQWIGQVAKDLGLEGAVEADQLTAMLTGKNPATGEPLGLRGVGGRGAVPGFDLTFSVPKSASLLWALGDKEASTAVTAAVERSLDAALSYLEREACWTRRGADAEFVRGSGFLAAAFRHRSSRNGDPQVHVHTLIANATQGPDGKWTRLYHPAIYDHAKTAGYLFEAHLRAELTCRLGVRWQEVRNGIGEIEGFEDAHLREFSTRRQQILEAAGPEASARSRQVATLATRSAKEEGLSAETLRERWHSKAREIGLEVSGIERGFDPGAPSVARPASSWQVGRAVTEGVSHFDRRAVVQAVAQMAREGMDAAEVENRADAFLASEEVVRLGEAPKGERFTTRRIWELEREALATVEKMRKGGPDPAGAIAAERVVLSRPSLRDEQAAMVRRLLAERTGIAVVIGEAGTGKTFAVVAAAEGWARAGIELRAAAPTWRAANVMRAEGLPAQSVASFLTELERPGADGLPREGVLLVDEAGMVGSADLVRLIDHADSAKAKLVLIGDPEQLSEIEAGGLFRAVAERSEPIYLQEVVRHRFDVEREGARLIREGEGREAIARYRSEERVIVLPDSEARRAAMVDDWFKAREGGEDAVMIAKRNAEVAELNALARSRMKEAGRVSGPEVEIAGERFAAGDLVITRVNDRAAAIYNRERWQVASVNAAERRIVLEGIDQARTVAVGDGYLARTNSHSDAPALQHAYAITTYSAQGTTVERAYLAADASMDKQELYVATSRSRGETLIYATPEIRGDRAEIAPAEHRDRGELAHLGEAAVRDRAQRAAHDVARLEGLPSEELGRRAEQLGVLVRQEREAEIRHGELRFHIDREARYLAGIDGQREQVRDLPRKLRRPEVERIDRAEAQTEANLARFRAEAEALPISEKARRELAAVSAVLAERAGIASTAARIAPPAYVLAELGQRPTELAQARAWDRGLGVIEGYRQRNGVKDRTRAFGDEPTDRAAEDRRRLEVERLRRYQQQLGRERDGRQHIRERRIGRGLGLGR
jgi:conjugative relaxase-like TrwC/TraI family protein